MKLYRYISLSSFECLLNCQTLSFSKPIKVWKDQEEGVLFKLWDAQKKLRKEEKRISKDKQDLSIIEGMNALEYLYCLCWCKIKDSPYMWIKYSNGNNAIMIEVDSRMLLQMGIREHSVELVDVDYRETIELGDIKDLCGFKKSFSFAKVLALKKAEYSCECERRAYIYLPFCNCDRIALPLGCKASEFISNVIVHPLASDDYLEQVKMLCEKYEILFGGRSDAIKKEQVCIKETI